MELRSTRKRNEYKELQLTLNGKREIAHRILEIVY